jgi:hypothetical protein
VCSRTNALRSATRSAALDAVRVTHALGSRRISATLANAECTSESLRARSTREDKRENKRDGKRNENETDIDSRNDLRMSLGSAKVENRTECGISISVSATEQLGTEANDLEVVIGCKV